MSNMNTPGYEKLADVLQRAYEQAAGGKGKERHAGEGVPFHEQPMATINRENGTIDGYLFQARKKSLESKRLPAGRAQAEIMGAIVYLAGAVIALDSWAADTLPAENTTPGPKPADCGCQLACSGGSGAPGCKGLPAMEQVEGERPRSVDKAFRFSFGANGRGKTFMVAGEKEHRTCVGCAAFDSECGGECEELMSAAQRAGAPDCTKDHCIYVQCKP